MVTAPVTCRLVSVTPEAMRKSPELDSNLPAPNASALPNIRVEALRTVFPVNVLLPASVIAAVPVLISDAPPANEPLKVKAWLPAPTVKLEPRLTVP